MFPCLWLSLHTHARSVYTQTLPPAVTARVNMSIVWPARQALIPEWLQAAEGKELKVSVCKALTRTYTLMQVTRLQNHGNIYRIKHEWQL